MDMLVMARDELRRSAVLTPPASYRGRLICQMVLASLLIVQCAVYLMIWVRDARRAGKTLNIFHIQRTQGGFMITIQALCAYIICTLVTGIVMMVHRCQLYSKYFADGIPKHMGVVHLLYMTSTSFGTLAYTFANFNSTILILRRAASAESTSRTRLWIYNASFLISIFGWLGAVIYIGIDLDPSYYEVYYISKTALATVEAILEDPSKLTAEAMRPLMSLEHVLPQVGAVLMKKCKEMIILAIVYSSFYALAGAFSLVFVWTLRQHTRNSRKWIHRSFHSMSILAGTSQATAASTTTHKSANSQTTAVAQRPKKVPTAQDSQHAALERLVADLTLSVPVVLLLSLYYPIAGGVAIAKISKTGWANQEFQNDIFCWTTVTMNNVIVAYFIWNSWKSPERYGAGNDRNVLVASDPAAAAAAALRPSSHVFSHKNSKKQHQLSIEVHEFQTIHISGSGDEYEDSHEKKEELPLEEGYLNRESQQDVEVREIRSAVIIHRSRKSSALS